MARHVVLVVLRTLAYSWLHLYQWMGLDTGPGMSFEESLWEDMLIPQLSVNKTGIMKKPDSVENLQ